MARNDDTYSYVWLCILYEEDPAQKAVIEKIKTAGYDEAHIIHDKDIQEDGTPKKPHYHFVLKFKNQKGLRALSKELGLAENYLKKSGSLKGALLYLIHKGFPEKAQYDLSQVDGSLRKKLEQYLDESTEDEKALKIIQLLEECDRVVTMKEFIEMCAKEGVFAELRRASYLFIQYLKEHNERVYTGTDQ